MSGSEPSDPGGGAGSNGGDRGPALPRGAGSVTLDPLIGRVLLDRYEVLRRIGSGGMGAVYVGRQPTVGREVALKVLRADLVHNDHVRQRFRREAEIIGRLKHPNTIQLIDYGETPDGLAVMVMELLEGKALNERLKEQGPMPVDAVLQLGEQVASSLAESHVLGLVHRDLKPANIFLTEVAGQVHAKVLDFGIARLLDEEATRLTSTGQVFGTPRYMSPEQAMSTADVDARSDLYSLGLILYECLVGQPPFVAQTSIQYLSAHTTQAPPKLRDRLPDAPMPLDELIDACLAKEPEDRPQTAEEVIKVLGAIRRALNPDAHTQPIVVPRGRSQMSGVSAATQPAQAADTAISTVRPPLAEDVGEGGSRGWVAIVVGGLLGLLVVGGVTFGMMGPWRDRPAPTPDAGALGPVAALGFDAGVVEVALPPPDAGDELDAGETEVDAGAEDPDAGLEVVTVAPDAGHRRHGRTTRKQRKNDGGDPQLGQGAIVGPRGMVIDVGGGADDDVRVLAKKCTQSVYSGLSKLTVKACPKDCAIIVDSQCAGRTPAVDRPIPPGFRTISVVCNGKIRRTASVRFMADEATEFRCR